MGKWRKKNKRKQQDAETGKDRDTEESTNKQKILKTGASSTKGEKKENWMKLDASSRVMGFAPYYEGYYRINEVIPPSEWQTFQDIIREPLPASFRVHMDVVYKESLIQDIKDFEKISNSNKEQSGDDMLILPEKNDEEKDGNVKSCFSTTVETKDETVREEQKEEEKDCFIQFPWYPKSLGYQMNITRNEIRKREHLSTFKTWLLENSESGSITRQETVSMIPPIVLDVQPHHRVLDMCAAPGSKTSQILEIINSKRLGNISKGEEVRDGKGEGKGKRDSSVHTDSVSSANQAPKIKEKDMFSSGILIANDSDPKRACMLMHQLGRMDTSALIVTNHLAQCFPNMPEMEKEEQDGQEGFFDRVLADVPCSGDGTMRKNLGIWQKWTPDGAFSLHVLQLSIAKRGLRLTKVGGIMVYSTCSMNPIEDEAVINALLDMYPDSIELVDTSTFLPGLKSRPGKSHWPVWYFDKKNPMRKKAKSIIPWEEVMEKDDQQLSNENNMNDEKKDKEVKMNFEDIDWKKKANDLGIYLLDREDINMKNVSDELKQYNQINGGQEEEIGVEFVGENDDEGDEGDGKGSRQKKQQEDESKKNEKNQPPDLNPNSNFDFDFKARLRQKYKVYESFFPPADPDSEATKKKNLHFCHRILPYDQNTGGFFIVAIRKVAPLRANLRKLATKNKLSESFPSAENECDQGKSKGKNKEIEKDIDHDTEKNNMKIELQNSSSGRDSKENENEEENFFGLALSTEKKKEDIEKEEGDDETSMNERLDKEDKDKSTSSSISTSNKRGTQSLFETYAQLPKGEWEEIKEFYGFNDSFPSHCLHTREGSTAAKNILFIKDSVRHYVVGDKTNTSIDSQFTATSTSTSSSARTRSRLNVMQSGYKFFNRNMKNKGQCSARLVHDALPYALPFLGRKRIVFLDDTDIPVILQGKNIDVTQLSMGLQERLQEITTGAVFCLPKSLNGENYENDWNVHKYGIVVWNGGGTYINVMLSKENLTHMKQMMAWKGLYNLDEGSQTTSEEGIHKLMGKKGNDA